VAKPTDLVQGTLDLLVALKRGLQPWAAGFLFSRSGIQPRRCGWLPMGFSPAESFEVSLRRRYTSHRSTACFSEVSGSLLGTNSCAT